MKPVLSVLERIKIDKDEEEAERLEKAAQEEQKQAQMRYFALNS